MSVRHFRSRLASWSIFGLVAASLVAVSPAAQANGSSGPVGPTDFSFTRESADGFSFVVKPNESADLQSTTSVDETWSGWPLPQKTVLSRNAFKVTTLPADVEQHEWEYRTWQLNDWQDENCDFYEETTTVKLTSGMTCARSLWVADSIPVENNSLTDKTVVTNAADLQVKYGKKTIVPSSSRHDDASASIYLTDAESVVITEAEDYLGLGFSICLAEETLAADDVLTVHPVVTLGSGDVTSSEYTIYDWSELLTNEEEPDLGLTYTVPTPEEGEILENLVIDMGIYLTETLPGTYSGSVDVKLDGTSVTEPCPTYDTTWPEVTTISGELGALSAQTSGPIAMPDDTFTENENFEQYSNHPDGFGGMFYWGYPGADWEDNADSVVNVVHMDGDTPNNTLAGAGEIVINTGRYGYFDIARFGPNGQNWFTLVAGNKGAYKFDSGTMASAGTETRNFPGKTFNGLCGKGFVAEYVGAVSAPTVNPLMQVYCVNKSINKTVLAKVVAGKLSLVSTLGTGSNTRPCVVSSVGTDTRASGTDAAVVFYTRVSSKDEEGYCGGYGATITSSRSITTVTAALVATQSVVNSNPWTGHEEPAFIEIAAGSTPGTWFGVTNEIEILVEDDYYSYNQTPAQLFSMTGSAITIESEITMDDTTEFGDWFLATPLSQSPGGWTLMISGSADVDSENIGRATVATINPETGVVTNGDVLQATGMGYFSGRVIGRFSADSDGNENFYIVTDADNYVVTSWSSVD